MCLRAVKEFKKPVREMIGWKVLVYNDPNYSTPFRSTIIKKNQKTLTAKGRKKTEFDSMEHRTKYHGGFIHCHQHRARAREMKGDHERVIKVKCYNVRALGADGDLVCDKIEFLWQQR